MFWPVPMFVFTTGNRGWCASWASSSGVLTSHSSDLILRGSAISSARVVVPSGSDSSGSELDSSPKPYPEYLDSWAHQLAAQGSDEPCTPIATRTRNRAHRPDRHLVLALMCWR